MVRLRRLSRRRSSRREEGCFLIDGPVLLSEAMDAGTALEAVYAEPDADAGLLGRLRSAGVEVVPVAKGSLAKVLDLVNPRSLVAVAAQSAGDLESVLSEAAASGRPVLAMVGLQDPGNAGTLIRVAEASGCAGVVFTDGSVDAWNPKVVRASAGSVLRMAVVEEVGGPELRAASETHGLAVVATVAQGGSAPEDAELGAGCVLLVGSEAHGVPEELSVAATVSVTIPMEGSAESLNAAVAGALVAFESARQRRAASAAAPPER